MGNEKERNTRRFGSLYEGAKTRVKVDYELSEEFEVKVGMHQGSMLLPYLFAVILKSSL